MSWTAFLLVYLLGGLTFLPISLAAVVFYLHLTLPYRHDSTKPDEDGSSDIVQPGDDISTLEKEKDAYKKRKEEGKARAAEADGAAGYFAVCREYTPMGINAKPIERSTPVGSTTVAAPSQSVYQTMYRSIFDRKPPSSPIDNGAMSQRPKRAGNVFYVALRHGHLMLFDDEEQLEVRHVISLAHHDVSIYSGGDTTPEGELYIKKNAICLSRKVDGDIPPDGQVSKPFYLFSESCSAKEDFYFALLRNQELALSTEKDVPEPLHFDVQDIISLVHRLHASEDQLHTRWLNALIGRVFLAVYKTRDLENFIRKKLTKKISRVKRPSFLSHIVIREVHPGTSAPHIFNPRLKELNVEGECVVEADIRYTGNFRIEVATTARIDLGARFKVREVDLVLSVALRKVEGHGLFKLKPPPSNRFWFAFQTMPKMEMNIEPIVSSRQITYTMIIRQIENRIKEVVAESIVLPFWDDTPFMNTENKKWRGGIWAADNEAEQPSPEVISAPEPSSESSQQPETLDLSDQKEKQTLEKSFTDPIGPENPTTSVIGRKTSTKAQSEKGAKAVATGLDTGSMGSWTASARSTPNVSIAQDSAKGEASLGKKEALTTLSAVAGSPPKASSSLASSSRPSLATKSSGGTDTENGGNEPGDGATPGDTSSLAPGDGISRRLTASSTESVYSTASTNGRTPSLKSQTGSISRGFFRQDTSASTSSATTASSNGGVKSNTFAAVSNAAIQAKQWGLQALQRKRNELGQKGQPGGDRNHGVDLSQPMGRGRPLPPPGTPLPPPDKASKTTKIPPPRKPLPPPLLPERQEAAINVGGAADGGGAEESTRDEGLNNERGGDKNAEEVRKRPVPPPPLPKRPNRLQQEEKLLVIAAPVDSQPGSPQLSELKGSNNCVKGSDAGQRGKTTEPPSTRGDTNDVGKGQEAPRATAVDDEDDGYAGWMDEIFEDDGLATGSGDEAVARR